jgi:hypothetical protein
MAREAEHVYTDPASICRLESLIAQLPANGRVVLRLRDGSTCAGVISTRPNVQVFRDGAELEGINAELRLEGAGLPGGVSYVWLDQIVRIEHPDSAMGSEN